MGAAVFEYDGFDGDRVVIAGFAVEKFVEPVTIERADGQHFLDIDCQRGTRVYRSVISGTSLTDVPTLLQRHLRPTVHPGAGSGGCLWLTTNIGDKDSTANDSDERILRVTLGG